jgi:hypothetical protein
VLVSQLVSSGPLSPSVVGGDEDPPHPPYDFISHGRNVINKAASSSVRDNSLWSSRTADSTTNSKLQPQRRHASTI